MVVAHYLPREVTSRAKPSISCAAPRDKTHRVAINTAAPKGTAIAVCASGVIASRASLLNPIDARPIVPAAIADGYIAINISRNVIFNARRTKEALKRYTIGNAMAQAAATPNTPQ